MSARMRGTEIRSKFDNSRSFAIDSIKRVIDIAKAIQRDHRKASQFCGALYGVLWSIKLHLETLRQTQDEGQKKVESLLNNLERLCSWPLPSRQNGTRSDVNRWPTLRTLQYSTHRARECLQKFASAVDETTTQSRLKILDKLKKFPPKRLEDEPGTSTQISESFPSLSLSKKTSNELCEDIKSLYSALRQYRSCERDGSHGEIITNIRLNGYRSIDADEATAEFGVLFLDHPHVGECHWQEACIQISHPKPSKPKIRFCDDGPQSPTHSLTILDPIPCDSFCNHISGRNQVQVLLSARNGEFSFQKNCDTSRNWLSDQQSISLATLLDGQKVTDKMKTILAFLLAKAVWQFYDSELMGQGLTKENVHFLFEQRGGIRGIYVNEPMLLTKFEDTDSKDRGDSNTARIHDMPKILALGIMLLELETRTFMETYREDPELHLDGPVNINTDYKIAKSLIDMNHRACILSEMPAHSPFQTILPMCIKAGELERKLKTRLSAEKKNLSAGLEMSNVLSATIYSEIVEPLEKWVTSYPKPDTVMALCKVVQRRALVVPRACAVIGVVGQSTPLPRETRGHGNSYVDEKRLLSRKWFEDFEPLKHVLQLQEGEKGARYEKVKIAVLDTGINIDDYVYYRGCALIGGYKDFVSTHYNEVKYDETGHGSTVVSLLVKMCPNASLYLARVLRTNTATSTEVENVVKAIKWAISKQVDIITMAIGFKQDQPQIAKAIHDARNSDILVFSAASNGRNIDPIYFPASRTDQVFGIFSTNAGIRESRSLNPSPGNRPHSFAIFGEDVELSEGRDLVRGTSYSTSMAAGLAGMLLDFSRQTTDRKELP